MKSETPKPPTLDTITSLYTYVYDSMDSSKELSPLLRRRAALSATLDGLGLVATDVKVLFTTHHQCAAIKACADKNLALSDAARRARSVESNWGKSLFAVSVLVMLWLHYSHVDDASLMLVVVVVYGLAATGLYAVCCDAGRLISIASAYITKYSKDNWSAK